MATLRPYILGLNNPQGNAALDPSIRGSSGQRLWQMVHDQTGITQVDWLRRTQRVNLLSVTVLPRDYRRAARIRASFLSPLIRDRTVIMLGSDVADALEHKESPFVWKEGWVTIPHPSGKNIFYNNPIHAVAVGVLFADLLDLCPPAGTR